jgi:1,4-alpha-glucan branching enzyme
MQIPRLHYYLSVLTILFFNCIASAQIITTSPAFPKETDEITITYDASLGNAGLKNHTGDVYAHTGVITNLSSSDSDWKYVKSQWRTTDAPKLTRVEGSANLYTLTINPSARAYYGVTNTNEKIQKLAFVFHDGPDGAKEGKEVGNKDIFVTIHTNEFALQLSSPVQRSILTSPGQAIEANASTNENAFFKLFSNGMEVAAARDTGTAFNYTVITKSSGKERIRIEASSAADPTKVKADSFYYLIREPQVVEARPAGIKDGINYLNDSTVILSLFAPHKQFVYTIGDFNNWEMDPSGYMKMTPDSSRFWITISNLTPQKEYIFQYFVDTTLRIGDPYAEKIIDPYNDKWITSSTYPNLLPYPEGKTTGIATVLQTAQSAYNWQVTDFAKPAKEDLAIYELHVRDFVANHNYATIIDSLDYLENLGINCIELMPIMEHEGNESWGYNPIYYFAPDKYYGPKSELKRLVDEAHKRGIAVVLDMVLNHAFGQSPMVQLYWDTQNNRPSAHNPWFNQQDKHPFGVGFDFNHESQATQAFVDSVNRYWIEEYHFDGYRFDLSKGFTQKQTSDVTAWSQYDSSRVSILKRMADKIWSVDSTSYVILEHLAENSEEKALADYGMMLWGNMNHNYTEASMGYTDNNKSDLSWAAYTTRDWNQPNLISYMESHDEERMMYKNLTYGNSSNQDHNIKNPETALERSRLAAAFYFTIPGPKMIWQFGELGYDYSINACPDGTVNNDCRTANKPIKWEYYQDASRKNLYDVYASLIKLRQEYEAFNTDDFTLAVGSALKRIHLNHASMNVTVLGNFGVTAGSIIPNFQETGKWYDYFSGDSIEVADVTAALELRPGQFHIYTTQKLPTPAGGTLVKAEGPVSLTAAIHSISYPNPFADATTISYSVPVKSHVTVKIYNLLGKDVATLVNDVQGKGTYEAIWDGKASNGTYLGAGTYFYRVQAGKASYTNKIIMTK